LPGVNFNFSQYIQDNIEEGISGVKGENSVKITGPNLETLTQLANAVRDQMAQVRGIADLGIFPVIGQPNLDITVNRTNARYGSTPETFAPSSKPRWAELSRRRFLKATGNLASLSVIRSNSATASKKSATSKSPARTTAARTHTFH